MLFFNIFNSDWFYQGIEEYSYIAVRSVVIKILSFVAMLLFVKSVNDYVIYALILCIAIYLTISPFSAFVVSVIMINSARPVITS